MTEKFEEMVRRLRHEADMQINIYESDGDEKIDTEFARRLHDELPLKNGPVAWICPRSLESIQKAKDSPGGLSYLTVCPELGDVPLYLHPAPKVPEGYVLVKTDLHPNHIAPFKYYPKERLFMIHGKEYQLVPKEPTVEMLRAGRLAHGANENGTYKEIYQAMLAEARKENDK